MPSPLNLLIVSMSVLSTIVAGSSFASPSFGQGDRIFDACAKREKKNLETCTSGCGLILKNCYVEAIEAYEKKIRRIDRRLPNSECKKKANEALKKADAFRDEVETVEEDGSWQQMDIRLLLTRTKLQLIEIMEKSCKPQ